jgi:uncharacterized membrane protein
MSDKTITAFFDSYADASDAVRRLEAAGFSHSDIGIVARNQDRHPSDGDDSADLLGGLSVIAVPGLGPVVGAGWLVSPLVGAGAGAASGGLVGTLVDAGVPEQDARAYEEGVRRGGALVTMLAGENEADRIVDILDDEGTVDFEDRQNLWRSEGWLPGHGDAIGAAASTTTGLTTGSMGVPIGATGALAPMEIDSDAMDSGQANAGETMSPDSDSSAMSRGSMEPEPEATTGDVIRGRVGIHSRTARRTDVEVYDERGRRITGTDPNRDRP